MRCRSRSTRPAPTESARTTKTPRPGGRRGLLLFCVRCAQERLGQALGRLPWFAPFFLRARRLRPVLPMVSSSTLTTIHEPRAVRVQGSRPLSHPVRRGGNSGGRMGAWRSTTARRPPAAFTVTDDDTASALGSGDLPVLATPRLLAWAEAATCAAVADELDAGSSSVGTRVQLEHVAASPVGASVAVTATVTYADGRLCASRWSPSTRSTASPSWSATGGHPGGRSTATASSPACEPRFVCESSA